MAIEEPAFTVQSKHGNFEIRKYGPVLVAETVVEEDFEKAGNKAFRILADYIFGNNRARASLPMTAPVAQQKESRSEKIAMTAPVNMAREKSGFLVQFTMPSKYTLETLPQPNDPRVRVREVPARRVAVFSYSGSWSKERYEEKLEEFKNALKEKSLSTRGEPILARFDSPFRLWFLRRNEIWWELAD